MIWGRLTQNIYNASVRKDEAIANFIGWGLVINALVLLAAICCSVAKGNGWAAVAFPLFFLSFVDYINSCHKCLSTKSRTEELCKRARLLARDRTLESDWKQRARTVHTLSRKIKAKEKRYGNYYEIDKAKEELNKAIDCIVRHSMLIHTTHAEIVQRDVDMILSAYSEL